MIIIPNVLYSQNNNNFKMTENFILIDTISNQNRSGSCNSPDGPMLQISSPPSSWNYLNNNNYCYNGIASTSTVTMCFTFVPTSSSVILNAGFSESCNNNTFGPFYVYNSSCVLVSNSLTPTNLIAGQTYTWCVTMRAWNGFFCNGYETFCPYWIDNPPLPIELLNFAAINKDNYNYITWVTLNEINNDYFIVERSGDNINWEEVGIVNGSGNSNSEIEYHINDYNFKIGLNYYRLIQKDFNGTTKIYNPIVVNNSRTPKTIINMVNIMGQKVTSDYKGLVIIYFDDGTKIKTFN